jgi:hypothetical protein
MDILYFPNSSRGHKYGLIIADLYSLYISFYPMKSKNSSEVAKNIRSYIAAHCPPAAVYSDNDQSFRGEVENLFRVYKVRHITSYPYTQRQNYVESQVRTFKNAYRAAISDSTVFKNKDWDILYPLVVCRINSMISKYGMSREAIHYGNIVESSLPIITDSKVFEPLEEDLDRAASLFKERMGRFMQKRKRNKEYYKIGKKYNFYIGELVMYKNHVQSSMLDKTYLGPARIIELSEKGASIRDTKLDTVLEVGFEHLRKINFEELLTLLPQNFDAEIAETLGTYRYRKVPEGVSDTKTSDTVEDTVYSDTDSTRKTRSGKVFKVKVDTLDKKYAETVKACSVRLLCIPKVVPPMEEKPPIPILKKKCRINHIMSKEEIKNIKYTEEWKEDVLEKIDRYLIRVVPSVLRSERKCTVEFILNGNKPPGRVKFGKITVHYY